VIVEVGDVRLDLTDAQVEALRRQLAVEPAGGGGLIDAAEVARRLGCSRDHVYAHADELGAVRVGAGSRPRLRFDPAIVSERLGGSASSARRDAQSPAEAAHLRRRRSPRRPEGELLPIRGGRP
jgi:hypothetical protein